jgi:hypothetical protein
VTCCIIPPLKSDTCTWFGLWTRTCACFGPDTHTAWSFYFPAENCPFVFYKKSNFQKNCRKSTSVKTRKKSWNETMNLSIFSASTTAEQPVSGIQIYELPVRYADTDDASVWHRLCQSVHVCVCVWCCEQKFEALY